MVQLFSFEKTGVEIQRNLDESQPMIEDILRERGEFIEQWNE